MVAVLLLLELAPSAAEAAASKADAEHWPHRRHHHHQHLRQRLPRQRRLHLLAHRHAHALTGSLEDRDPEPQEAPAPAGQANGTKDDLPPPAYIPAESKRFGIGHGGGGAPLLGPDSDDDFPLEHSAEKPSRYHPFVDRSLDQKEEAIKELQSKRVAADQDRQEFSVERAAAMAHMNDAVGIQREEARAGDIAKSQTKVVERLEKEGEKLKVSHDALEAKLTRIMEPKLNYAEQRLEKERRALEKWNKTVETWEERTVETKKEAVSLLKERRDSLRKLKLADEVLAKAKHEREELEKAYRLTKIKANGKVEAFRWADTEYRASLDKKAEREAAADGAAQSYTKYERILAMEKGRIDQALSYGETRLERKLKRANMIREKAGKAAELLRDRYGAWQEEQRKRARQAAEKEEEYEASLKAYAEQRHAVFNSAQAQAGERAEAAGDWAWDDWAWSNGTAVDNAMAAPVSLEKPLEE